MVIMKNTLIILLAVLLGSCATTHTETISSTTACCSIIIDTDNQEVRYEADGYHSTAWYDNQDAKEYYINDAMEYCYKNH
jgi:maltose-binding protein MalE